MMQRLLVCNVQSRVLRDQSILYFSCLIGIINDDDHDDDDDDTKNKVITA